MKHRAIEIERLPSEAQRVLKDVGDEPMAVEQDGQLVYMIYPTARLSYRAEGPLQKAAGAWHLPNDVAEAISGEG